MTKNNNRIFDEQSVNWLKGAKHLKQSGMTIEAIKAYVDLCLEGESTISQRYEILFRTKRQCHGSVGRSKLRANFMEDKVNNYRDIMNRLIPDNMNPGNWSKMKYGEKQNKIRKKKKWD